jgi:hypothetical protein
MNYIGQYNDFATFFELYDHRMGNMHIFANGVMLGATNGSTILDASPSYTDIVATQMGGTPVDQIISGTSYKLSVPVSGMGITTLAQMSPLVQLDMRLGKLVFSKGIGVSLKQSFSLHIVMANATADGAPDFSLPYAVFPSATLASPLQMSGSNDQRTTTLEFELHTCALDAYAHLDQWFAGKRIVGFTSHELENAPFTLPEALLHGPIAYSTLHHSTQTLTLSYPVDTQISIETNQALLQIDNRRYAIDHLVQTDHQLHLDLRNYPVKPSSTLALYLPWGSIFANGRAAAPLPMMLSSYQSAFVEPDWPNIDPQDEPEIEPDADPEIDLTNEN